MKMWEYAIFESDEHTFRNGGAKKKNEPELCGADLLNELGQEGWELVSTVVIPKDYIPGLPGERVQTAYVRYIFKRPVE